MRRKWLKRITLAEALEMMQVERLVLTHQILTTHGWTLRRRDGWLKLHVHCTVGELLRKRCRPVEPTPPWQRPYERVYELA